MANVDNANASQDQIHSADHKADPKSSSSSSASVQEYQDFEATTAVLDTNELLHMIVAEVPLNHRASLLEVSRTWNAAAIKIGYTLQPSGYQPSPPSASPLSAGLIFAFPQLAVYSPLPDFSREGFPGLPMYSSIVTVDINPAFPEEAPSSEGRSKFYSFRRGLNGVVTTFTINPSEEGREYYKGFTSYASEIVGHEDEFITNPPLTQVLMCARHFGEDAAILRVREGIRIRDLVRCQKKMLRTAQFPDVWWHFGKEGDGESPGG
jgi:hypothetical protein